MDTYRLSPPELAVLRLIAQGLTDPEIAAALGKSPRTIHTHRDHLFIKTNTHNRVQLTRVAIAMRLVPIEWKNTANDG